MSDVRLVMRFKECPEGLILSQEHIRQLTEWFGPDQSEWQKKMEGKEVVLYHKNVLDSEGNVLGSTIGLRLATGQDKLSP